MSETPTSQCSTTGPHQAHQHVIDFRSGERIHARCAGVQGISTTIGSTSAPRITYPIGTAIVPPMRWCGVHHAHVGHTWVTPSGTTGLYAMCPGSNCRCTDDGVTA